MEFIGGVLAGVIVATITQVFSRVFTEPILDLRELIGEVADSLIYYANVYNKLAPPERTKEAQYAFRRHASRLRVKAHAIVLYWPWSFMKLVPRKTEVIKASKSLIGLSNWVGDGADNAAQQADRVEEKIKELLNIETDEADR